MALKYYRDLSLYFVQLTMSLCVSQDPALAKIGEGREYIHNLAKCLPIKKVLYPSASVSNFPALVFIHLFRGHTAGL